MGEVVAACECRLADHQHAVPCGVSLRLASRGREGEGAWKAHHIVPESDGGSDNLDNCALSVGHATVRPSDVRPLWEMRLERVLLAALRTWLIVCVP